MERYTPESTSIEIGSKEVVAELEGCLPSQLGTLQEAVEIDELESFMEPLNTDQSTEFEYCGYTVQVSSDSSLYIDPNKAIERPSPLRARQKELFCETRLILHSGSFLSETCTVEIARESCTTELLREQAA